MQLKLNKSFAAYFPKFTDFMSIKGKSFRAVKNRETLRFVIDNKTYFIKKHFGVGWKELLKNLLQFRLPIFSAKNELLAIQKLQKLGIPTMTLVGFDQRGLNPITKQSFIITEELQNTIGLRDICEQWRQQPLGFALKKAIIEDLAHTVRILHQNGIHHRDLYMAHVWLDRASLTTIPRPKVKLYIMDLHRAQIYRHIPKSCIIKDIAAIYFSAMYIQPTTRDILRFVSAYFNQPWHKANKNHKQLLHKIEKRAQKLYIKSSEQFIKKQNRQQLFICDKHYHSPPMRLLLANPDDYIKKGIILKNDATTTIAKINLGNDQLVIKRYNTKNIYYFLTHLLQQSRAKLCWNNSHLLQHYNISTPRPIAIIEKRFGPLRGKSYFISEYIPSTQINDFFLKEQDQQTFLVLAKKTIAILIKLRNKKIRFRDTKATNFLVAGNDVYLVDLDGMRKYSSTIYKLRRSFSKDKRRFMKNWQNYPDIEQLFLELYDKIA